MAQVAHPMTEALSVPIPAHDHIVQFYERDSVLVDAVASHLRSGLESGGAAIVIATPGHGDDLVALWTAQGCDVSTWIAEGRLSIADAEKSLQSFLVDDWPDAALFDATIGRMVADANARFGRVQAFGEMVALLWARERYGAAVYLEGLWNGLAVKHRFSLYCAYPMRDCGTPGTSESFEAVCRAHSHVVSAEMDAAPEVARGRMIAALQQKARALEHEIAVRQRVEALLADRERELSDFLENGVYALHRVGPDGTILWANKAELRMLGYEAREYIGRNIAEFHLDKEAVAETLRRLGEGDTLFDRPAKLLAKDGTFRHVLMSSSARIENGKVVSTRCFTRDVTDRWLAQEALRERGAVLHLAMQGARMGYWVGDLDRNAMRCSQELASMIGLSGTFEWQFDAFMALIHPDDRQAFRSAWQACLEQPQPFLCQFRVRRDTSDWRWFEARGEAVYDHDGVPRRFYGVCMDVTARKRDEQSLLHLAAIVDSAEDAIISKGLDGIIRSWNAGSVRLYGYEAAEVIGKPITIIIPPDLHYEEKQILDSIKAGRRVDRYETRRLTKDGTERQVSIAVSPIRDPAGRIVGASNIGRPTPARVR